MTPSTLAGGLLAGLLLASAVGRAPAQSAVAAEIGVIETVDPASGRRLLHVLEGLGHAEVRAVQRELARAGFEVSWQAGVLDAFTRGALQRFQTQRGLAVCACVTIETLIELGIPTRIVQTIVVEAAPLPEVAPGARAGGGAPEEAIPGYVGYDSYYPYGVAYLVPFIPHPHDPHGQPTFHPGGHARAGRVPAAGRSPAMMPRPAPFPRVSAPPNVVRGS
jgi:peptidoglycan hydrolase-like protein with peptidoglycan-binding domain